MNKTTMLLAALLLFAALLGTVVLADENYHGEDGTQPGTGVIEGPGDPAGDESPGDRTRFKDV